MQHNCFMQKIQLYILLCIPFLLGSCGRTDESIYEGGNIVEGTWTSYFENTDSIVLVRVFTPDYYSYFSYAEGKEQNELNKGKYHLNSTQIFLPNYTQTYQLIGDSLWITNSQKDQTTKYIRTRFIDSREPIIVRK